MQNNEFTVNILNADQLYVEGKRIQQLDLGTLVSSDTGSGYGIGIKTDKPRVTFDISGTDGLRIPFGNTSSRPQNIRFTGTAGESTDYKGVIRYNTETEKYESWLGTNSQTSWGRFVIEDEDYYTTDISSNILIRGNHTIWGINGDENNSSGNLTLRAGGTIDKQGQVNYIGTNISNADKSSKITLTGGNSTNISLTTANQDRMIIDSNGKIGIGVTSPVHKVDISANQTMVTNSTSIQSKVITNSAFDSKNITNNNMYLMLQHGTGNSSGGIFSGIARSDMGGFSLGVKYDNSIKNIINANSEGFMNINIGENIHDDKLFLAPYVFGFNPALTTSKFVRLDNNKSNNSNLFISNMEFTTSTQQTNFGKNGVFIGKGCTLYSDTTNNPELLIFGDNPISNGGATPQSNGGGILLSDKMRFVTYKDTSFVADSGITSHLGQAISHSKKLQLNSVTRMVIDKDGKVGIGTDNPLQKLHVKNGRIFIEGDSGGEKSGVLTLVNDGGSENYIFTEKSDTDARSTAARSTAGDLYFRLGAGPTGKEFRFDYGNLILNAGHGTNLKSVIRMFAPFYNYAADQTPRVAADVIAGFDTGAYGGSTATWGGQFISFNVGYGNNGSVGNDGKQFSNEVMRINSRGRVGIGTTNPEAKLHVNDGTLSVTSSTQNAQLIINPGNANIGIDIEATEATNTATKKAICLNTYGGNVGIHNGNPQYKLDVNGDIRIPQNYAASGASSKLLFYSNPGYNFAGINYVAGPTGLEQVRSYLNFFTDNTNRLTILKGGNVGIGTNSPQARLDVNDTSLFRGEMKWRYQNSSGHASHALYGDNLDWYIRSGSESGQVIIQDTGGNVRIGSGTPTEKLYVNGNIYSTGFVRGNSAGSLLKSYYYANTDVGTGDLSIASPSGGSGNTSAWLDVAVKYIIPTTSNVRFKVLFDCDFYVNGGSGTDRYESRIVATQNDSDSYIITKNDRRSVHSSPVFPIIGVYASSTTNGITFKVQVRRESADDSIHIRRSFGLAFIIEEIKA